MCHYPLERPSAGEALQLPWILEKGGKPKPKKGGKKPPAAKGGPKGGPLRTPVSMSARVCTLSMVGRDKSGKGKATPRPNPKAKSRI